MSRFVPNDFKTPEKYVFGDYYLVPITTRDAIEDWLQVVNNAEIIVKLRGGGVTVDQWRCSLEESYKDLAWLEYCARYKQLFAYIIRKKENNMYIGCVYIYPIELFYPKLAEKYDVDFSFWITEEEYKKGKYEFIYKNLLKWLVKEWEFTRKRIYLRNKETPASLINKD